MFGTVTDWTVYGSFFVSLRTCDSLRNLREMQSELMPLAAYVTVLNRLAVSQREEVSDDAYSAELSEMLLEHDDLAATHADMLRRRLW